MTAPALRPDVGASAFLLGTWSGKGVGRYPTVAPVAYREEVRFWPVGKPFPAYAQRTWAADDGRPSDGRRGPAPERRLGAELRRADAGPAA